MSDVRSKYATLTKFAKNILINPHDHDDIECSFSISEDLVTPNWSMLSDSPINGLQSTYNVLNLSTY
ncbi:unnamed protein product [Rotaria sp. Silwood2]|nr:unnamed protein product [Rotaria sp. Silwood2]CAF2808061.1 unnamed protein product [Rotaria sp. Silwood2]CAF3885854.1 unnamed protein product [Rotaria sp. Silwood2]CAF4010127.1 unnamed protein product [Rotaria sp. Silwood2]